MCARLFAVRSRRCAPRLPSGTRPASRRAVPPDGKAVHDASAPLRRAPDRPRPPAPSAPRRRRGPRRPARPRDRVAGGRGDDRRRDPSAHDRDPIGRGRGRRRRLLDPGAARGSGLSGAHAGHRHAGHRRRRALRGRAHHVGGPRPAPRPPRDPGRPGGGSGVAHRRGRLRRRREGDELHGQRRRVRERTHGRHRGPLRLPGQGPVEDGLRARLREGPAVHRVAGHLGDAAGRLARDAGSGARHRVPHGRQPRRAHAHRGRRRLPRGVPPAAHALHERHRLPRRGPVHG